MPQKENFNSRQVLATYIDDMVTAKMGAEIEPATRAKARQEVEEQLEGAFQRGMIEALPDTQLVKLNELLDQNADDAQVEQLFASAGVKYEEVILKVLKNFREKYLGTQAVRAQGAVGQPMQGTISEVPGASNVEGVANNQEVR